MLGLIIDMLVIWFLLNGFSDRNWDDSKLQVFLITLAIAIGGWAIDTYLGLYLGFFSIGAYVVLGGVVLKVLADLTWSNAFKAMGIFLSYKIVFILIIVLVNYTTGP